MSQTDKSYLWGLFWTLVRTDFKTRYHGSLGGLFWALLKPLSIFTVLLVIFSFIFASDPDYKLNLIVGLFLWDFFSEGTKTGLGSIHAKGFLIKKAKFPSWIVIVASLANPVLALAIFTVVITLFLSFFGHAPGPVHLALLIFYEFLAFLMVLGFSLAASELFLRYRDLNQVWDVVMQAGFFVAPVIYPLEILPEQFHFYLFVWPPTPIIQFSRAVLIDRVIPTATAHAMLVIVTLIILATGIFFYQRYAPRSAEYL